MKVVKTPWILIILLLTAGCAHYSYIPNMHNVPLFQNAKELHMALSGTISDEVCAIEAQTAYSVTKHIGIIANGFIHSFQMVEHEEYCNGRLYEVGPGIFLPLSKHLVYETYAGMGFGEIKNTYHDWCYTTLKYNRYFLQPSVGFISKYFYTAVSLRLGGLKYNDPQYTEILGIDEQNQIEYINQNPFSVLFEPAVILRVGDEFAKFQINAGYSGNISNPDLWQEDFYFSFGFRLTVSKVIKAIFNPASSQQLE